MTIFFIKVHNSGVYKTWIPGGVGGGYCHTWAIYIVYSGMGYINQRVWVWHRISFFQETDQLLVEDFSLDWANQELPLKNQMGFVLAGLF